MRGSLARRYSRSDSLTLSVLPVCALLATSTVDLERTVVNGRTCKLAPCVRARTLPTRTVRLMVGRVCPGACTNMALATKTRASR
jgi:hypothetical protein